MALSADAQIEAKDPGNVRAFVLTASTQIYKGAMVCVNPSTGLALAGADTANYLFLGIATENVLSAASGTYRIKVYTTGVFLLPCTSLDVTDQGKIADLTDDEAVVDTATNNVQVGKIIERVSATSVWIDIAVGVTGIAAS